MSKKRDDFIEHWESKTIADFLSPKPIKQILNELFGPRGDGKNHFNTIRNLMQDYEKNRDVLITIVSSEEFDPSAGNGVLFREACINNLVGLVGIMLRKNYDPSINNNYALRLAYHHNSSDVVRLLITDDRVTSKIEKQTLKQLKEEYTSVFKKF